MRRGVGISDDSAGKTARSCAVRSAGGVRDGAHSSAQVEIPRRIEMFAFRGNCMTCL